MESKLFTPVTFGPLTLRNRTIRSAAFESMCPGNAPSDMLLDYHRSVAAGGIGMTTVAYAAVTQSGLSFDRQLWMRPEIIPGLRKLTDAIHAEGAAAGIRSFSGERRGHQRDDDPWLHRAGQCGGRRRFGRPRHHQGPERPQIRHHVLGQPAAGGTGADHHRLRHAVHPRPGP